MSPVSPPTNEPLLRVLYLADGNVTFPKLDTRDVAEDDDPDPVPDEPSPKLDELSPDPPKVLELAPLIVVPMDRELPKVVPDELDCAQACHGTPATSTRTVTARSDRLAMVGALEIRLPLPLLSYRNMTTLPIPGSRNAGLAFKVPIGPHVGGDEEPQ